MDNYERFCKAVELYNKRYQELKETHEKFSLLCALEKGKGNMATREEKNKILQDHYIKMVELRYAFSDVEKFMKPPPLYWTGNEWQSLENGKGQLPVRK